MLIEVSFQTLVFSFPEFWWYVYRTSDRQEPAPRSGCYVNMEKGISLRAPREKTGVHRHFMTGT